MEDFIGKMPKMMMGKELEDAMLFSLFHLAL